MPNRFFKKNNSEYHCNKGSFLLLLLLLLLLFCIFVIWSSFSCVIYLLFGLAYSSLLGSQHYMIRVFIGLHPTIVHPMQSLTKGWRKIYETKQNRFLYGMFLQFVTEKCQNLSFGWPAGYLPSNSSFSRIFLKFTKFLRSWILSRSTTCEATGNPTFWW